MANYANQIRILTGNAKDIAHKEGIKEAWLQPIKWDPLNEAMRILKGNAFKLYMYLLSLYCGQLLLCLQSLLLE